MAPIIVAVDFDSTVCAHPHDGDLNKVGPPVPGALGVLEELCYHPDIRLMLWTMRSNNGAGQMYLDAAVRYLTVDNCIKLWGINQNPDQHSSGWSGSHKQYATCYIDDAAIGCPLIYHDFSDVCEVPYQTHVVDWEAIRNYFVELGYLKSRSASPKLFATESEKSLLVSVVSPQNKVKADLAFVEGMNTRWATVDPEVAELAKNSILTRWEGSAYDVKLMFIEAHEKWGNVLWFSHLYDDESSPFMSPHFAIGMQIRNALRSDGVKDEMVPDGNLDDYYVQMFEYAMGWRDTPKPVH